MSDETITKECPCVVCWKPVTVTKFATPAKVKCTECKAIKNVPTVREDGTVDKGYQLSMPEWSDVTDRELRNLACLSCGHDMVLVSLIKSERWGDIIRAQCPHCFLSIAISEQSRKNGWMQTPVPINHLVRDKVVYDNDVEDTIGNDADSDSDNNN